MAHDPTPNREALREARYIAARLAGHGIVDAGADAGVGRTVSYELEARPTVQDAIRETVADQIAAAGAAAANAAADAVETMVGLMRGARSEAVRLRAAEALLAYTSAASAAAETEATLAQLQAEVDRLMTPRGNA